MRKSDGTGYGGYVFGFEAWGLALFLGVMLPNFVWFAVPAPNDVLRAESVTETVDVIGSVCQAAMLAALCLLKKRERPKLRSSPLIIAALVCCAVYWTAWVFYYLGAAGVPTVLALTLPPCGAFVFFALDRKNYIAALFALGFTVCHIIFAAVNFIL